MLWFPVWLWIWGCSSQLRSHILLVFPLSSRHLFLSFHTRSACQSIELSSSHPKSHLACPRREFEMMNPKKAVSASVYSMLFIWIWIQVRVLFTGDRKGREGCFSFPSCTSNRTQIGTEGWTVSAGISIPLRQTCQEHPLSTTRFRRLLKHNQRPGRWTPRPRRS